MARAPRAAQRGRTRKAARGRGSTSVSPTKAKRLKRIGIVDTAFARYDMASATIDELRKQGGGLTVERYTVPRIKELAAAARILFDRGCGLGLALRMLGRQPLDQDCDVAAAPGLHAVRRLLERADVDAAVAIGAVIKGETLHDEALMAAVPKALLDVQRDTRKPVGLGITGPGMTDEQAMARVDKGAEAVDVALAMHELLRGL